MNFPLQDARSQKIMLTYLIEFDKPTVAQCLVVGSSDSEI